MTIHHLKTWPSFFRAVSSGDKTFELRKDDRGYRDGDVLHLQEYDPRTETYTGSEIWVDVTYLMSASSPGIEYGHVCMAIKHKYNGGPPVPEASHRNPVG